MKLEDTIKSGVSLVVKVTVELQDRLRNMFLPTASRCHYIFTTKDLSLIFRLVESKIQYPFYDIHSTSVLYAIISEGKVHMDYFFCFGVNPVCLS